MLSFAIASSDRVAGKSSVPVTLGFTPTTPIPSGGTITLTYPSGFFASGVTPQINARVDRAVASNCSQQHNRLVCSSHSQTSILPCCFRPLHRHIDRYTRGARCVPVLFSACMYQWPLCIAVCAMLCSACFRPQVHRTYVDTVIVLSAFLSAPTSLPPPLPPPIQVLA